MLHYRISSTTPITIHQLVVSAMSSSSSSASPPFPSSSFSSSSSLYSTREKYTPPTSPHYRINPPLPFTRPLHRTISTHNTPPSRHSRSRCRTLGRAVLLFVALAVLGTAVNEWVCGTEGSVLRSGFVDLESSSSVDDEEGWAWGSRHMSAGGEGSGFVGGGAVIGRLSEEEEEEGQLVEEDFGDADTDTQDLPVYGKDVDDNSYAWAEDSVREDTREADSDSDLYPQGGDAHVNAEVNMQLIEDAQDELKPTSEYQVLPEGTHNVAPAPVSDRYWPDTLVPVHEEEEPVHTHVQTGGSGLMQVVNEDMHNGAGMSGNSGHDEGVLGTMGGW
ncbi:uncharacterized protein K460DRAFT_30784 [Cucurbitaria berberidis CBS 394.84]|uniref:Uncharacterized protein n=1 Tax=Cucurbitaria berberidis CBS 394.84 TaxID=1168544 RepID=A0A9P4GRB2_9PLEO|nr:uncharacterized protein K460DRAFT_30784 [Cucurbitaria berberidis CBS 394.84]KAF1851283.1 hypothetical protein K460DRAFT_30784 [Cucurbitaria berberidis CBS 394.84]